jgi:hypothetical protein
VIAVFAPLRPAPASALLLPSDAAVNMAESMHGFLVRRGAAITANLHRRRDLDREAARGGGGDRTVGGTSAR